MRKLIMVVPFVRGEKLHLFHWNDEYRVYWNYGKKMTTCFFRTASLDEAKAKIKELKAKGE